MTGLGTGADARQGLAGSRKQPSYASVALDFVGMNQFPGCCHPHVKISPLGLLAPPYQAFLLFFPCLSFQPWRWCWLAFWLGIMPAFSAASLHLRAAPCSHPGKGKYSRTDFVTVKHKNSLFFFSMSHLLSAPITHAKWVQTGGSGWGHKPPGTVFGVRQVTWPSGHIPQPLPVRAGICGGCGGANSGLKRQKSWAVEFCFAGASQDFLASSIPNQC